MHSKNRQEACLQQAYIKLICQDYDRSIAYFAEKCLPDKAIIIHNNLYRLPCSHV